MAIDDDIAALARAPSLHLLGRDALRVLAIGADSRRLARGDTLYQAGEPAEGGYVVQSGAFRIITDDGSEMMAGPGTLLGEVALMIDTVRPATAVATDNAIVIRITRNLFQKVLESDPEAARRLRDDLAARTTQATSEMTYVRDWLTRRG